MKKTHWQGLDHVIGPATRADFPSVGQQETRDALEAFILEHSEVSTRLLDAGCSSGVEAWRLFEKGFQGTYLGLDSNPKAIVHAIENLAGRSASFALSDLDEVAWPDRTFDIVLTKDVIEHAAHYGPILGELGRLTRRWLVLSMFIRPHEGPDEIKEGPPGLFHNRYQRSGLVRTLEEAGFAPPVTLFVSGEDEVLVFERIGRPGHA